MKSKRRLVTGTLTLAVGAGVLMLLLIAGLQVVFAVSISTDFMQCANDDSPYPLGDCHWIGSILQANNSVYLEGMSVPQRAIFDGIPATTGDVHTLEISHQATKGGIHAYDFLTSWDQAIAAAPTGFEFNDLHGQACGEEIGHTPDFATICSDLHGPGGYFFDVPLPGDPFISNDGPTQDRLNAYEALYGPRTIRIYSNAPIIGASVTLSHNVTDGNDTGDSYIDYTLTYTSTGTQLLVELAGHLSVTGDYPTNQLAWGPDLGASQIQGGPYHFNLGDLDGISLGNQDNQIKGADILIVPGQLIVDKVTDPAASPQLFDFDLSTGTGDPVDTFSLADQDPPYQIFLNPGTYSVTETVPSGWDLTNVICSDQSDPGAIGLDSGETVTCTFYDTLQRGTIIVEKQTDPDGDSTSFSFSGDAAGSISDGQQIVVSGLLPDTYTSQETVPAGWDLTSIICDDANSSGDVGTATATFDLGPGETVTCTFTDTQRGTIIVEKQTDPDGNPTSFTFTGDAAGSISDGQQIVVSDLLPGTYTSQETVPAGWNLTSIICDDANSSGDLGTATATFDLEPGETVSCTFTDTLQRGTIIVEKQTDPDGNPTSFTFTGDAAGSISDGQQIVVSGLLPGTYTSQETVPAGWDLTSIICDDANSSADLGTATATFDLGPGETVTCTFTDTQRGAIIVRKVTDPSPDLSNASFGFTAGGGLSPTGFSLGDGDSQDFGNLLPQSGYSVAETTIPLGWNLSSATCDDGSPVNNIDVAPGETVTCTFTNTATPACIEIQKTGDECSHAGEEVSYHFWVHNCGDFDLENVTVTDPLWDPDLVEVVGSLAADDGAAGGPDEYSFDEPYTVPSDASEGAMANTATAAGTDILGRVVNDQDGHVVDILDPCIDVTKTHLASSRKGGEFFWGDKVTYKIRVENCSADTTLYNVKVVDQWESPYSGVRKSWPTIASLAPGETRFFSYIYTTKKADGAAIVNKAIVTGDDGCELVVTDEDFDDIPLGQPPDGFVPEWDSILLLASGLGPLAAYARMRLRKRA